MMRPSKFHTDTLGRGLADRKRAAMRFEEAKKEEEIFAVVEGW